MYRKTNGVVSGYRELPVAWQLIHQEERSDRLAILLPGLGYSVQRSLLYYATSLLTQLGYDVLHVNYDYKAVPEFATIPAEVKNDWVSTDVQCVLDDFLAQNAYDSYALVAKSIGTLPLANELSTRAEFREAKAVWLTPMLSEDDLFERMMGCEQESLYVIGDRDPFYVPERLQLLAEKARASSLMVAGADHNMDSATDVLESVETLGKVLRDIKAFTKGN